MGDFSVTILGNGSAVPTSWHKPTSQMLKYNGMQFLLDCGEGTQMQMIKYGLKLKGLDHIFITHLHGDHFFGLMGLLTTMHLMRRKRQLRIFCPIELKPIIEIHLSASNTDLSYRIFFDFLEAGKSKELYEDEHLTISYFPLKHSIPVWGFLFKEKTKRRRIDKEFIQKYQPTIAEIEKIISGGDYINPKGNVMDHIAITNDPPPPGSYAFCGDTCYLESTARYVEGVSVLYHEATFDNSNEDLAAKTLHSTAQQAARVAKEAGAGKLLLGHYSARFKNELSVIEKEARAVFENSVLSQEGEVIQINK